MINRQTKYPVASDQFRKDKRVARWTGEKRAPRAGEWFLSGAIVEAYYAQNDLDTAYHIAELVPA